MSTSVQPALPSQFNFDAEAQRLAALHAHGILDTAPEPEFDALARLAAQLLGAPIAFVGLLDVDRFWIKAGVGLDAAERRRDVALCACELMAAGVPVVVDDLSRTDRCAVLAALPQPSPLRFFAAAPIVDSAGHLLGAVGVLDERVRTLDTDQSDRLLDLALLAMTAMQARQRGHTLLQLAQNDPLTGAADAHQFEQALEVELRHSMRTGEPFAVLRLDLDGFADINTAYGQAAGDAVLREVGRRLHQQVRHGDLLARLGSDDFGIVMRHGGHPQAKMLVARIMAAVRQPIQLGSGGEEVSAGISIGVATYSDEVSSVAELLALADASLVQARSLKESRWMVFGKLFNGPDMRLVGSETSLAE